MVELDNRYALPMITFVAGEKQTIRLNLRTAKPVAAPFNADSCKINFSMRNYSKKYELPIISKLCSLANDDDGIPCIAIAELNPLDTVTLDGKYIYQVSIIDSAGDTEIPSQGIIYIVKNINQGFIQDNLE